MNKAAAIGLAAAFNADDVDNESIKLFIGEDIFIAEDAEEEFALASADVPFLICAVVAIFDKKKIFLFDLETAISITKRKS